MFRFQPLRGTRVNEIKDDSQTIELTQDNVSEGVTQIFYLTQDIMTDSERFKANQAKEIALLQNAITPRAKGGSYAANNATGLKKLVEEANRAAAK